MMQKENKKPLDLGKHQVKITSVWVGKSEIKKSKFIAIRLENNYGFITQRFYFNDFGRLAMRSFFNNVGNVMASNYNYNTMIACFNAVRGQEINTQVIETNGHKTTIGWQDVK